MAASLDYDNLIKQCIKPMLKVYGFSSKGHTFIIKSRGNIGLINFQKSRQSNVNKVIFTINVGIISNKLRSFFSSETNQISIEDCHWRQRIGFLLPERSDKWWIIDAQSNIDELCEEIKLSLVKYVINELEKNIYDENLIDLWRSRKSPGLTDIQRLINLSALLKIYGRYDILNGIINEMRLLSINKPFSTAVEMHIRKLTRNE
jgi:hypothetical protein